MRDMYGSVTKVMIDARSGASLLNLPLDRLLQTAGGRLGADRPGAAACAPLDVPPGPPAPSMSARAKASAAATAKVADFSIEATP